MIVRDPERIRDAIIPGTTQLVGRGRGHSGELWGGATGLRGYLSTSPMTDSFQQLGGPPLEDSSASRNVLMAGAEQPPPSSPVNTHLSREQQVNIKQVACGAIHMLLLDFSGRCWALGSNHTGQLGIGRPYRRVAQHPVLIDEGDIRGEFIEQIAVGGWFSAFLSRSGLLFTSGTIPRDYRRGGDDANDISAAAATATDVGIDDNDTLRDTMFVPRRATTHPNNDIVVEHDDIRQRPHFSLMACGTRSVLVQDQSTMHVYAMGNNQQYSLGTDETEPHHLSKVYYTCDVGEAGTGGATETRVRLPVDFPCKKLGGGSDYSVLLDTRGALYMVGGSRENSALTICHELFDRGVTLVDVCCSTSHFIALSAHGDVYWCYPRGELLQQLSILGPVAQIGASHKNVYARTHHKKLYQIEGRIASLDDAGIVTLSLDDNYPGEGEIIGITGFSQATVIHHARLLREPPSELYLCSLKGLLCDTTIHCSS